MRVQIPAYTDRWMMGDRFGTVLSVKKGNAGLRARLLTSDPHRYSGTVEVARVKLDKSGVVGKFILSDCEVA